MVDDTTLANEIPTGDPRIGAYPAAMDNYDDSITTTDNYDDSITTTARMNDVEYN